MTSFSPTRTLRARTRSTPPVAGPHQTVMVPGQVEFRRKYTLWVLIVLVLLCWPAAIIYYFTRDKVPVQELQTYAQPLQYAPNPPMQASSGRFCPSCGTQNAAGAAFCSRCGKPMG